LSLLPKAGFFGFGSKPTKNILQTKIDDGNDLDVIQEYPTRGGPDFRQSYTALVDSLQRQGVSEKDVISGIINSFQLNLGSEEQIQRFANIFYRNLDGGASSFRNVAEWLRLHIMLKRRAPVGPDRAAPATPVAGWFGSKPESPF
jgi:hypothetical protein